MGNRSSFIGQPGMNFGKFGRYCLTQILFVHLSGFRAASQCQTLSQFFTSVDVEVSHCRYILDLLRHHSREPC